MNTVIYNISCLALSVGVWLCSVQVSTGQVFDESPPDLQFSHYDATFGLATAINDIETDSLGFMWLGTGLGLMRFDGYDFKPYGYETGDSTGVLNAYVRDVFVDREGMVWASTDNTKLARLNVRNNKTDVVNIPFEGGVIKHGLQSHKIIQDSKGKIWVISAIGAGMAKVDPASMAYSLYTTEHQSSMYSNAVFSMVEDNEGWLWIGYSNGAIDRLNPVTDEIIPFTTKTGERIIVEKSYINTLFIDRAGRLWSGTDKGLYQFDKAKERFTRVSLGSEFGVQNIFQGMNGALWLSTFTKGLVYYHPKTEQSQIYIHSEDNPNTLVNNTVYAATIDHSQNIWISTSNGLSKADLNPKKFSVLDNSPSRKLRLSADIVAGVVKDSEDNLWVATIDGLNKVDSSGVTHYYHDVSDPKSLPENDMWSLFMDSKDNLWGGFSSVGIGVRRKGETKWENPFLEGKLPTDWDKLIGFAFYEDSRSRLWIGANAGLFYLDPETGEYHAVSSDSTKFIYAGDFWEDEYGILWVATSPDGLVGFDINTLEVKYHFLSGEKGLATNNINALGSDDEGMLWVGTDSGIYIMERKNGEPALFHRFSIGGELVEAGCGGILRDQQGEMWVITGQGIDRVTKISDNPLELSFTSYNEEDGITPGGFVIGANYVDEKGMLYLGGVEGLTYFNPLAIEDNPIAPRMAITGLKLADEILVLGEEDDNGRLLLNQAVPYLDTLQLHYTDRVFTISFAAMHYSKPDENRYKYRLLGFQDEWQQSIDVRQATYTNIPGGTYIFEVVGANLDNQWSERPARLTILIQPPFWETTWFRVSAGLFVFSSLIGFYQYRTHAMREHNKILEKRVAERTVQLSEKNHLLEEANIELEVQAQNLLEALETNKEILGVTVHDLKNPLGGVIGLSEIILDDAEFMPLEEFRSEATGNVEMLKVQAEYMLQCIQDMLNKYRGEQTEQPRRENTDLLEVLINVLRWNQKAANDKEIKLINNNRVPVPVLCDVSEIQRAMDNFISNAIKYSPTNTEVQLLLETNEQVVRFTVKDQGPGLTEEDLSKVFGKMQRLSARPTADEHSTGLGLYSAKELIESHAGKVGVDSVYGEGAAFWFELPLAV